MFLQLLAVNEDSAYLGFFKVVRQLIVVRQPGKSRELSFFGPFRSFSDNFEWFSDHFESFSDHFGSFLDCCFLTGSVTDKL